MTKAAKIEEAVDIQRRYYTETAARYDSMHAQETSTDPAVLNFVVAFLRMIETRSILDVGTGTGLGLREINAAVPGLFACGVEPVAALIREGLSNRNPSQPLILQAAGDALPFRGATFDVVCEFGMLHHASNPDAVVSEMLRVAKKAVFLCDSNRFGQGSTLARLIKLFLWKTRLWRAYTVLRTGGKGYLFTEGDGLAYSYSVYDSYHLIARWADRVILVPVGKSDLKSTWLHPLLTSSGILLCAFKDRP